MNIIKILLSFQNIPSNRVLGKFIRLPLRLIPGALKVKILSGENKGYKWFVGAGLHSYWLGIYETYKQLAALLQRYR
jgi:hypothetical protein